MEIVKRIKPRYNKYVIYKYVKQNNIVVLWLPPNYCELNPIEMAWSVVKMHVKMNNTTFKIQNVQNLLCEEVD